MVLLDFGLVATQAVDGQSTHPSIAGTAIRKSSTLPSSMAATNSSSVVPSRTPL